MTYKDNKSLSDTAEITSEYVPLTSLKPGISGTITIHGRNANSDGGKDFNATYAGVIPTPRPALVTTTQNIQSQAVTRL